MHKAIRKAYQDDRLWQMLVNNSFAQAGPFDGGCLICAVAIVEAAGQGEIVRMVSGTSGVTQHYGALVNGLIYDFLGSNRTAEEWLQRVGRAENITDRSLLYDTGIDKFSDIVADQKASSEVAHLLGELMLEVIQAQHARATRTVSNSNLPKKKIASS